MDDLWWLTGCKRAFSLFFIYIELLNNTVGRRLVIIGGSCIFSPCFVPFLTLESHPALFPPPPVLLYLHWGVQAVDVQSAGASVCRLCIYTDRWTVSSECFMIARRRGNIPSPVHTSRLMTKRRPAAKHLQIFQQVNSSCLLFSSHYLKSSTSQIHYEQFHILLVWTIRMLLFLNLFIKGTTLQFVLLSSSCLLF